MDGHPWTKYEIARLHHEERLSRAREAMRALEVRQAASIEPEVKGPDRMSAWLDHLPGLRIATGRGST